MAPQTIKQWNVAEKGDFEKGLTFNDAAPVPTKLGDSEILVHCLSSVYFDYRPVPKI